MTINLREELRMWRDVIIGVVIALGLALLLTFAIYPLRDNLWLVVILILSGAFLDAAVVVYTLRLLIWREKS
jgi:high-affinity Fe2+/Pb2+ permease